MTPPWSRRDGGTLPLLAVALHDGHEVRDEVAELLALDEAERLREEDPYTGAWTSLSPTRFVVHRSRFEVDMNRSREESVYLGPEHAWGLRVWQDGTPPDDVVRRSRALYDRFYGEVEETLRELERRFGGFLVYDLHSYNHRRNGPEGPEADAEKNPEVNVGTGSLDRKRWAPVVEAFMEEVRGAGGEGPGFDVRENVRFRGGWFSTWVHRTFPGTGCVLAIEVKKFFMDEWTGALDPARHQEVGEALRRSVPGAVGALERVVG